MLTIPLYNPEGMICLNVKIHLKPLFTVSLKDKVTGFCKTGKEGFYNAIKNFPLRTIYLYYNTSADYNDQIMETEKKKYTLFRVFSFKKGRITV